MHLSGSGTASDDHLILSDLLGDEGILTALYGADGMTGETESLSCFSLVKIYDRKSGQWLE